MALREGEPHCATLILQGTPFERGRQHGLRLQAEIHAAVAALKAEDFGAYECALRSCH